MTATPVTDERFMRSTSATAVPPTLTEHEYNRLTVCRATADAGRIGSWQRGLPQYRAAWVGTHAIPGYVLRPRHAVCQPDDLGGGAMRAVRWTPLVRRAGLDDQPQGPGTDIEGA